MNNAAILNALETSDEFLMILTSKQDFYGSVDVNIILGCDLTGNTIKLLERALVDIKDAAKQYLEKSNNTTEGDGYQISRGPAKNNITTITSTKTDK